MMTRYLNATIDTVTIGPSQNGDWAWHAWADEQHISGKIDGTYDLDQAIGEVIRMLDLHVREDEFAIEYDRLNAVWAKCERAER
jgi:hypothetical protein